MRKMLGVLGVLLLTITGCVQAPPVPATGDVMSVGAYGLFTSEDATITGGRFSNHYSPRSPADAGFKIRAERPGSAAVTLTFGVYSAPGEIAPIGVGTMTGSLLPGGPLYTWFSLKVGDETTTSYFGTATITAEEHEAIEFQGPWGTFSENLKTFRASYSIVFNGELVTGEIRIE